MFVKPMPSVVLFVENVRRMAQFYAELAQMVVVHDEPDHAVLAVDGMELVVHALPVTSQGTPTALGTLRVRKDAYWKFCLPVESISSARVIAMGLGGMIGPIADEWEARGFRACDGSDPEGNVLQVRESAA